MENLTDKELVKQAGEHPYTISGTARAQSAPVEMMRRLKNSINFSSWAMIALTIILIIFTAVLIWQGV